MRWLDARDVEYVLQKKDRIAVVKRTLASWIDELNTRREELDRAEAAEAARLPASRPEHRLMMRDRAGIRARYDLERSAIRRSETFARKQTRNKILKIRHIHQRQHQRLERNRAAVRRRFEKRSERLRGFTDKGRDWLVAHRLVLARDLAEMESYCDIHFAKYLRRIIRKPRIMRI